MRVHWLNPNTPPPSRCCGGYRNVGGGVVEQSTWQNGAVIEGTQRSAMLLLLLMKLKAPDWSTGASSGTEQSPDRLAQSEWTVSAGISKLNLLLMSFCCNVVFGYAKKSSPNSGSDSMTSSMWDDDDDGDPLLYSLLEILPVGF